ncbi:MAG: ATP-dependent DNA helicase [Thermoplasmata archaeon]|nr:ATP-dependent DNA helicase [Thermoplasmata archaeon]
MEVFPYEYRPGQRELVSFIDRSARDGLCPVVEAGTGTGKTVSALAGTIPLARDTGGKVVYLTRTKSQQSQVIRECSAIGGVVCIGLQGRSAATCPMMRDDPDLRSGTPEEISKLCSELKRRTEKGCACPYFANLEGVSTEHWLDIIRERHPEPEELAALCEEAGICPYELLKRLLPEADVIAASYPFMFMPQILARFEEWLGITVEEMVAVVDEAHNLPDYLRDVQTYEYSLRAMEMVDREAKEHGDNEIHDGLRVTDISAVLREVLQAAVREYLIDEDGIIPPGFVEEELMTRLGTTSVNISRIARGLMDYGDIIEERKKQRRKLPRSYIGNMGRFLELWLSGGDDRSVRLVIGGDNSCFQSYCMDPAPAAAPLNACRASLLMSGTLEPLEEFVKELGMERPALHRLGCAFPAENLLTLYTDRVSMKYEERFLEENYRTLKSMLLDTVLSVRVNTAVFFPSYDLMDRMIGEGLIEQLGRDVYQERRGMPQDELMDTFGRFKTSEGSVLFCVTGGRISEGLDFPDKALELAVIIGIPFPKPTAKLRAMERYYDARFGNGRRYVVAIPAARKMRQSIGRLIRSETDRGVAAILDRRVVSMDLGAMLCSDIPAAVSAFLGERRTSGRSRGQHPNKRR